MWVPWVGIHNCRAGGYLSLQTVNEKGRSVSESPSLSCTSQALKH